MQTRSLGKNGPHVSAIGLGCMGMSEFYGPADDAQSISVIHEYLAAGGNFLDTADMYGVGHNETLVGKAIKDRRTKVFLATKFGNVRGPKGNFSVSAERRNMSSKLVMPACSDSAWITSICITSTAWTPVRPLKIRLEPWRNWCKLAR